MKIRRVKNGIKVWGLDGRVDGGVFLNWRKILRGVDAGIRDVLGMGVLSLG